MAKNKRVATKTVNLTIRFTELDYARLKRACYRDEMKPTLFAYDSIMSSLERLVHKQETKGFQCQDPL